MITPPSPEHARPIGAPPLQLIVTNTRTGVQTKVEWLGGETFRQACRRHGLPALMSIEDP